MNWVYYKSSLLWVKFKWIESIVNWVYCELSSLWTKFKWIESILNQIKINSSLFRVENIKPKWVEHLWIWLETDSNRFIRNTTICIIYFILVALELSFYNRMTTMRSIAGSLLMACEHRKALICSRDIAGCSAT